MQLGTSIALFIVLAIVLMALFCLISKYFQYKMNKRLQETGQIYTQVDQLNQNPQDLQGQYDQFLQKKKIGEQPKKKKTQQDYLMQITQVQAPLTGNTDQIYGISMLRRRLDGQVLPMKQQTGRSSATMRSFRPQRLNTNRSNADTTQRNQDSSHKKPQQKLVIHEYISKLVVYNQQGLIILDVILSSVKKDNGKIIEKKTVKNIKVSPTDDGFDDQLEVLGFDIGKYSCFKTICNVEMPHMVDKQEYLISNLKVSQAKEEIDFSEYYLLKDKVQSS